MMADKIKIAVAAALLMAGITAFYYWSESLMIIRVTSVIAGTVAGAVAFWTSTPGKEFFTFAQESVDETKRVVWPTRKETLQTTGIVMVFVVIMAIFLGILDAWLAWLFKVFLGWGASS